MLAKIEKPIPRLAAKIITRKALSLDEIRDFVDQQAVIASRVHLFRHTAASTLPAGTEDHRMVFCSFCPLSPRLDEEDVSSDRMFDLAMMGNFHQAREMEFRFIRPNELCSYSGATSIYEVLGGLRAYEQTFLKMLFSDTPPASRPEATYIRSFSIVEDRRLMNHWRRTEEILRLGNNNETDKLVCH